MNPEVEKQVLKYLIELAESPPVQAEIEAARVAILNIIETEAAQAVPWGLRTIARLMRWIYKKLKGDVKIMSGIATITANDGTNVLDGVSIAYTVNSVACTATTDSTGIATIEGLDAGSYEFTASLSGYTSASITLTVTDDATVTGTISLTKETTTTTEGESTVSTSTDVSSAAETAAITSVISSVTSGATEFLERLFTLAETEATRLEGEVKTTTDFFVACRDKTEAVALRALIAAGRAGEAAAVVLLVSKLKDKIS